MQKDTGFNEKLVTYLYALEVRACMRTWRVSEVNWQLRLFERSLSNFDVPVCPRYGALFDNQKTSL